ncbi:MAG: hypothetical protein R3F55_13195 [Alphaproteobacteria bacterium]
MLKRLTIAVAVLGPALAGGPAFAINSDPCGDIVCDNDGTCLACWEEGSDDVVCSENSWLETKLICDSDEFALPLQLTAPTLPEIRRFDLRTIPPQLTADVPAQPRTPSPNR